MHANGLGLGEMELWEWRPRLARWKELGKREIERKRERGAREKKSFGDGGPMMLVARAWQFGPLRPDGSGICERRRNDEPALVVPSLFRFCSLPPSHSLFLSISLSGVARASLRLIYQD